MLGMYLVIESWLNSLATSRNRGSVFAIYMTVTLLAMGSGQYLLVIYDPGSLSAFSFIALLFSLALVPIALTKLQQPVPVPTTRMNLGRLYSTSPLAVSGALISGVVNGAFWGMGPIYALSVGFDAAGIALFMSALIFGGALLQWPLGHLSDNFDRRLVIFGVSLLAGFAALTVFYTIDAHRIMGLVATFIFGGCAFSIYSLSMAHANDQNDAEHILETNRGVLLLSGIGSAIGPILAGLLMQGFNAHVLMILFAGLMLLLAALAMMRRSIGVAITTDEQSDFVVMARTSPAIFELDPRN
jgi:MFS family permease